MAVVPIAGNAGLYQELTSADTDYPIAIPTSAVSVMLWFEDDAGAKVEGRIQITGSSSAITVTNTSMGVWPDSPGVFSVETQYDRTDGVTSRSVTHLHLASSTAGAIVKGTWLASS